MFCSESVLSLGFSQSYVWRFVSLTFGGLFFYVRGLVFFGLGASQSYFFGVSFLMFRGKSVLHLGVNHSYV